VTVASLIAVEGIDGAGKGTQTARLQAALTDRGYRTRTLGFPRYDVTQFGGQIGAFLNGRFGPLEQVHPLLVSLLFAGDRFESRAHLQQLMHDADVVLCDRYVASNLAHQGAKLPPAEREGLIRWILWLEHDLYELPRANLTLLLDAPVTVAQELVGRKALRSYTAESHDLQEADAAYLQAVRDVYRDLARQLDNWQTVSLVQDGVLRPPSDITLELLAAVLPRLPQR
jgi:dTMP kinase